MGVFSEHSVELANNSYSYTLLKSSIFGWRNLAKFGIFGEICDEICTF